MAIDSTARSANFRDSIKKYFVEGLKDTEKLNLTFDKSMSEPYLQTVTVDKWVNIRWGPMIREVMSRAVLEIYCCTREDNEGFKLAQLTDKVYGYLIDENATHGMKTIPFYRSSRDSPWVSIGGLLVWDIQDSADFDAVDGTKFRILTVTIRFASKL